MMTFALSFLELNDSGVVASLLEFKGSQMFHISRHLFLSSSFLVLESYLMCISTNV